MKKLLSAVLVLSMILSLGTMAFASGTGIEIKEGETIGLSITVDTTADGVFVTDTNSILKIGDVVKISDTQIAVAITAPEKSAGKITKIVVKNKDGKVIGANTEEYIVTVKAPETSTPSSPAVMEKDQLDSNLTVSADNVATLAMDDYTGISAEVYNHLKNQNYDKIVFVLANSATWTLTRGDYTKMNITAPIHFGAKVSTVLTKMVNGVEVRDEELENKVLKALGNTKADPFYVIIDSKCNIANVASKPELVVKVDDAWLTYNNQFSVSAYSFNGETVKKVASSLAIKPATGKMTLNLTAAGTYVFVGANTAVNPIKPSEGGNNKPNAGTGANNATAAVVALIVMAAAAVACKKVTE